MVLLVIFVVVTVILLCCVYFVVASLLFHVCVYVPTCVLYRSGKEERPWPISEAKINNQSINHQS